MTVQGQTGTYPVSVIAGITGPVGPVGLTGPIQQIVQPVGITGPVQVNQPVGVTGPVAVQNAAGVPLGVTGPIQVTQPTGPNLQAQVQGLGTIGVPAGNILTVQGVTGATEISVVANDNTQTNALGSLNATATVLLAGTSSIGFQLAAGTLIGTIVPEISYDGGATWNATFFDNPSTNNKTTSITFSSANPATGSTIIGAGGAGLARIRVSAYTSGTANCTLRASQVNDPSVLFSGPTGATGAAPPTIAQIGGVDSFNTLRAISTDSSGRPKINSFITSPNAQSAGLFAFPNAYGTLRVSPEPMAVFIDNFNGTIIDTTNWATPVVSGGGTVTQSGGILTLAVGTTGAAYATINTSPTFYQDGLGFLIHASTMKMEAATVAGTYRFWGQGTIPGSPAVGTPVFDGIGFEVDTSGNLNAVIYNAGTKIFSQVLTKPTDGAWHRYGYFTRPDTTIWYIDSMEVPVASVSQVGTATNLGPSTTQLPVLKALYNPTVGPGSAPSFQFGAVALSDSTNSAVQIADGAYPWRNATINALGQLAVTSTPVTSSPGIAPGYVTTASKTNVALNATVYNEQSANFTGSVVSSSANDTSAGTGARTIKIFYVDATGATAGTETATLNGTTPVNLVTTTKCFIEKIQVLTVGSVGSNVGTITLFTGAAGAGTAVAIIAVGDELTNLGHHYVVTGKTCYITDMTGNTNSQNQTSFTIQATSIPTANQPGIRVSDWIVGSQVFQVPRVFSSPIKVTGPARIQMFAAPGSTSTMISYGAFGYFDQ